MIISIVYMVVGFIFKSGGRGRLLEYGCLFKEIHYIIEAMCYIMLHEWFKDRHIYKEAITILVRGPSLYL